MTLKNQRWLVFGSLSLQLVITTLGAKLLTPDLPNWLVSTVMLLIPYVIWLIQVVIGRGLQVTRGISSGLLAVAHLWYVLISLNGYERMLVSPFLLQQLPYVLIVVAVIFGIDDWRKSLKKVPLSQERKTLAKGEFVPLIIATLLPIFALYPGKAPRMTLAYVDQGVPLDLFSRGFLEFLTLPSLLMLILASLNVAYVLKRPVAKSRKYGSVGFLLAMLLFIGIVLFAPYIFWTGVNPLIFSVLFVCGVLITPTNYQFKSKKELPFSNK